MTQESAPNTTTTPSSGVRGSLRNLFTSKQKKAFLDSEARHANVRANIKALGDKLQKQNEERRTSANTPFTSQTSRNTPTDS